jgi:hypothetical protein
MWVWSTASGYNGVIPSKNFLGLPGSEIFAALYKEIPCRYLKVMSWVELNKRRLLRISVLVISQQHHPITSLANEGDRSLQHYIRRWKQE